MTDDLAAFIAARLDEDEAAARHAAGLDGYRWLVTRNTSVAGDFDVHDEDGLLSVAQRLTNGVAAHIARHDPARVLREVAAKRAILALHHPEWTDYVDGDGIERSSLECAECEPPGTPDNWPCPTLRHLAAVWSGHPDYRDAWKP